MTLGNVNRNSFIIIIIIIIIIMHRWWVVTTPSVAELGSFVTI